jgi:hypothetical protein
MQFPRRRCQEGLIRSGERKDFSRLVLLGIGLISNSANYMIKMEIL